MTIQIFAQKFQLDGFLWFLRLWTTHSCRKTFVTNLFTEILTLVDQIIDIQKSNNLHGNVKVKFV